MIQVKCIQSYAQQWERVKQKDIKLHALMHTLQSVVEKAMLSHNKGVAQASMLPSIDDSSEVSIESLTQYINTIESELTQEKKEIRQAKTKIYTTMKKLAVGEEVILVNTGAKATVVKIRENNVYTVRAGILNIDLEREKIRSIEEYRSEVEYHKNEHEKNIDTYLTHEYNSASKSNVSIEIEKK